MKKKKIILRIILATLIVVYFGYGFHRCQEESDVVKLDLDGFNPPIYDFPYNQDTIKSIIKNSYPEAYGTDIKEVDKDKFIIKRNNYSAKSYRHVYRKDIYKTIYYFYDLVVILDSLSADSTRIIVEEVNVEVQYGVKFWRNLSFDSFLFNYHKIPSEGIREYEFLRLIGKRLGYLEHMPYVIYPQELTPAVILNKFGDNNPFTYEEMFGEQE